VPTLRRILLALAAVLAGPLLGLGSRVHAGYVAPASHVGANGCDALMAGGSQAAAADQSMEPARDGAADPIAAWDAGGILAMLQRASLAGLVGSGLPASGAGGQPGPGGPNAGCSLAQVSLPSCPRVDPCALIGRLFREESLCWPPPFPSLLFRPPRCLCV